MLVPQPILSIEIAFFSEAQRLRDTVNAAYPLGKCRLLPADHEEFGQCRPRTLVLKIAAARRYHST
jgi:hypothetical protein